ncbi:MAG: HD domain-containing phosphohydrolase [Steroidobacteraceae bacterium]
MDADTKHRMPLSETAVFRTVSALRQAESRYRRLFETARDGILLLNADTAQVEDVNPYLIEMLGYSYDEFLGKKLWEVGLFTDEKETQAVFEELQTRGYVRYDDLPLQSRSGGIVPVEFVSNSYDCDGIKVIQCNIREISERKRHEAQMRRLTGHYAALSACNKAIVRSTSEAALLHEVCRAAVQLAGMKMAWVGQMDAATGRLLPVARFGALGADLHGDGIAGDAADGLVDGPARQLVTGGQPFWCQDLQDDRNSQSYLDLARRQGVAACAALPLYRTGVVTGAFCLYSPETNAFDESARNLLTEMADDIGFALDNFDLKLMRALAERRRIAAEERFRTLVEQSAIGIYIVQDGKLVYANPFLARMVGLESASTLVGTEPGSWVVEKDRGEIQEQMARLRNREVQEVETEFELPRPDGSTVPVLVHASNAVYEDRPAVIGTARDISERKRSERAAQQYIAQLKAAVLGTVNVAMTIGEMRDPYTAGHERRVAALAVAIAVELGLDSETQEALNIAGHLHDVGKVMVPSEILSKPGKLSHIEMQLVQGHCQAGHDILKSVDFPWPVAEIILQHHERLDGSGYPRGLKGEAILREARILVVADVVEAMSSHRPYRPGLGVKLALAEIERGSGTEYAPDVVDACLSLFRDKDFHLPA